MLGATCLGTGNPFCLPTISIRRASAPRPLDMDLIHGPCRGSRACSNQAIGSIRGHKRAYEVT